MQLLLSKPTAWMWRKRFVSILHETNRILIHDWCPGSVRPSCCVVLSGPDCCNVCFRYERSSWIFPPTDARDYSLELVRTGTSCLTTSLSTDEVHSGLHCWSWNCMENCTLFKLWQLWAEVVDTFAEKWGVNYVSLNIMDADRHVNVSSSVQWIRPCTLSVRQ